MRTHLYHITISLILLLTISIFACSPKENTEKEVSFPAKKSVAGISGKTIKTKETIPPQEKTNESNVDKSMQALENIQLDVTNSQTFLAMNANKEGVNTTASGLQYRVLTQGNGSKPNSNSVVQVHYRGTFPNGEEFDSSYKRGEPANFAVTRVIKGWTEGLLLMNEGSKYELVIPSELAYGARGAGNVIPPNQVLKFEVELLNANLE